MYILGFSYSQNMVFEVFGWNILSSINLFFWRVMCLRHSFWKRQGNECLVLTSMDTFASMEFCLGFPIRWLIPKSRLWYNGTWSWFFTLNHNLWMAFEKWNWMEKLNFKKVVHMQGLCLIKCSSQTPNIHQIFDIRKQMNVIIFLFSLGGLFVFPQWTKHFDGSFHQA